MSNRSSEEKKPNKRRKNWGRRTLSIMIVFILLLNLVVIPPQKVYAVPLATIQVGEVYTMSPNSIFGTTITGIYQFGISGGLTESNSMISDSNPPTVYKNEYFFSPNVDGTKPFYLIATVPGTYEIDVICYTASGDDKSGAFQIVVTSANSTMTFDSEGGTSVLASTVTNGASVSAPTAPTKTGYAFGGWYDGDNGTGTLITFPHTLSANKTVYAKWTANPYTVTYDPGPGTVSPTSQTKLFGSTYGKGSDGTTAEAMPIPTQTGYIFGGWYTAALGAGSLITDSTTVGTATNHTLYAKWTVETHTLTFDAEGGSAVTAITQNYNTSISAPTVPTRAGHTFGGWYSGDNGTGTEVTFPHTLIADKTVYAKWTANPYTVTYDPGPGTVSPTSQTKLFGSTYGKGSDGTTAEAMPIATQTGYIFGGWYTAALGAGSLITDSTTVGTATNHTLYAKWTVETHTLTFDAEGGSAVTAITQNYNTSISAPTVPTRAGHTFGGWYSGDNGTGTEVTFPHTLIADKTVYAKWTANPYTVTYDPGPGTVSPTSQTKLFGSTYGKGSDGTTAEAMPIPTQTGYIFGGWYTAALGAGSLITDSTTVGTATNHTLYAKWTVETHTLTFDAEGGSAVTAITQNYNTSISAPTVPTRAGHTFGGWYSGDNGTGMEVTFPHTLIADKTVYAKWTANPYTVTYDPGPGTVSPTSQTKLFGSTYGKGSDGTTAEAMPIPTQTGYIFGGWYTAALGAGSLITDSTTVGTATNHTLYAKWTVETHTLTFDAEGGSAVTAITQNYNTSISAPTVPTRAGHTFGGWYSGDNGTGMEVTFPHTLIADKTVYAKWTANPYTVTYDPGPGTVSPTSQTKLFGSTYGKGSDGTTAEAMPIPTQTGYIFGGWYTAALGAGSLITDSTTVGTATNHTLYAKWTVETHTLTFDAEGGSAVTAITQNYNTSISAPTVPTRAGHTFGGWYSGDNGTGTEVTFPYALTANKTVYAKWTINTYTITFKNNYNGTDGTDYMTQSVIGIKAVTAPIQPVRTGYVFGGWYVNNTCNDAWNFKNNMVENHVTLFAKWTAAPIVKYIIAYTSNGATSGSVPVDANDYAAGSSAKIMANTGSLAKAGYVFSGWSNNGVTYTPGQTVAVSGDFTMSAVWTAVPTIYTATYLYNYTGGNTYTTQPGISSGSTLIAPTIPNRTGYSFVGWYKDMACTNPWNFNGDAVKADATLYAKWVANIYNVSGNVVDDQVAHLAVSGATVKIIQGNAKFGSNAITDASGNFAIAGVPDGTYNLVVTKENRETTVCITISGGNYVYAGSLVLPSGNKNSTLNVIGSDTPNVVVDNLHTVFSDSTVYGTQDQNTVTTGGTVEIKLTVKKNDNSTNKATVEAAMSSGGYTSGTVLDVDLTKTSTSSSGASEESSITTTNNLIKIIIPLPGELQGKANYVIYRAHDYGSGIIVDAIKTTPNVNGEYIAVNGNQTQITAYLKYFSTYAIAYANKVTPSSPSSSSSSSSSSGAAPTNIPSVTPTPGSGSATGKSYGILAIAGAGGNISPSGNVNVGESQAKTFTITANQGYKILNVFVDGTSIGSVTSYTFSNVNGTHTIEVQYVKITGLPYYLDEKGNNVFIGFSINVGGVMNYIAPQGKTVLFKENQKIFKDTSKHRAKAYIDFVTERELISGVDNNRFSPETGMTRAMFVTTLGRLYEKSYGKLATTGKGSRFKDVDYTAYYGKYLDWAVKSKLVSDKAGGKFRPNQKITREEMAVMLYRLDKLLKIPAGKSSGFKWNYPDASSISTGAVEAVKYCKKNGFILSRSGGKFVPRGAATRAEIATTLQKFIKYTVNNKGQ